MAGSENHMGTLVAALLTTGWHPIPSGKSTLKVYGTYGPGTVTFKTGKKDIATGVVKEGSLLTDGVFDSTTASSRNINLGTGVANSTIDVIQADLTGEDGTTDLDIYIAPYEGPR